MFFNWLKKTRLKRGLQTGRHQGIARWSYEYSEWTRLINDWLSRKASPIIPDNPDDVWKHEHNYGENSNTVMPFDTIISADGILFNYILFELGNENQPKASYRTCLQFSGKSSLLKFMGYTTDLTDPQFERLDQLLPRSKTGNSVISQHEIINAIFYQLKNGC